MEMPLDPERECRSESMVKFEVKSWLGPIPGELDCAEEI